MARRFPACRVKWHRLPAISSHLQFVPDKKDDGEKNWAWWVAMNGRDAGEVGWLAGCKGRQPEPSRSTQLARCTAPPPAAPVAQSSCWPPATPHARLCQARGSMLTAPLLPRLAGSACRGSGEEHKGQEAGEESFGEREANRQAVTSKAEESGGHPWVWGAGRQAGGCAERGATKQAQMQWPPGSEREGPERRRKPRVGMQQHTLRML